ncbi:RteC domain-containing protein [Flavobacterium sp.]|uniref:RteC domain-containing protein n=1 Tax=Flavobacterium sp. TaxID=239 RepID=UPI0037526C2A
MNVFCNPFFIDFENEFEIIKNSFTDAIIQANEIIRFIERKIKELYNWLKTYVFESSTEEIYFFKELKPKLVSRLIFYKNILKLESNLPIGIKLKKKCFEKSLDKVYQQSRKDKDFYQYYRSRATHKDEYYFIRNYDKSIVNHDCSLVNYDEKLCSTHDYKVAILIANDLLLAHLEDKLEEINDSCNLKHPSLKTNLNWTGNKIDLIEVIYALHHQKVINGGNIDIKDLAVHFGFVFNIDLEENIYRSYVDIKNRKTVKTKFLHHLSENFNTKIIEEEH